MGQVQIYMALFPGIICIIRKKAIPLCPVWKMLLESNKRKED